MTITLLRSTIPMLRWLVSSITRLMILLLLVLLITIRVTVALLLSVSEQLS